MSRPTPLLSIVVPVHRVARHLRECLDSIIADPSPRIEVIVVDDGAPAPARATLDAYAASDPRLRVIRPAAAGGLPATAPMPVPGGSSHPRDTGRAHARGRYLWFVDAGDLLTAPALDAVLSRLAGVEPDVLVVDHAEVDPDGTWRSSAPPGVLDDGGEPGPLAQRPRLLALAGHVCTKVIRRGLLDETGLRLSGGAYEDGPFCHTLLLAAGRIDVLDLVCYCRRSRASEAVTRSETSRHFDVFHRYAALWAEVAAVAPAYDRFRPDLFRLMIDHYLAVAGEGSALPSSLRREFFARMTADYRRHLPAAGYLAPGGFAGLNHRLVGRDAYRTYAGLRLARHAAGWLRGRAPDPSARLPGQVPGPAAA